jgi:hypothetical protein
MMLLDAGPGIAARPPGTRRREGAKNPAEKPDRSRNDACEQRE